MDTQERASAAHAEQREKDAALVELAKAGDQGAFSSLYDAWFDRVYDVAVRVLRDQALAADVAQDAFLSAWRNLEGLEDPKSFGGWLLRISQNRAFDRRRKELRANPVDAEGFAVIEDTQTADPGAPAGFAVEDRARGADNPASVAEDAELADLLWDSAQALGERDSLVLDLHLRHDLDAGEIAETLDITRNNAHQLLHRVRKRLGTAVAARVLWRRGRPRCDELTELLAAADVTRFDADVATLIERHAKACDECSGERETQLAPSALFGAVPVIAAPLIIKERVAAALASEGVPMGPVPDAPGDGTSGGESGVDPDAARRLRRRVAVAGVAVGVVLLALIAAFFATGSSENAVVTAADKATPTRPASPTSSNDAPDSAAAEPGGPATTDPSGPGTADPPAGAAPDPAAPPPSIAAPAPPPAPAPTLVRFSVSPGSIPAEFSTGAAPRVGWVVAAGDGSVSVSGPGLSSTAFTGSAGVCPGPVNATGTCLAPPGSYSYSITIRDATGAVVDSASASLTIL